VKDAAGPKPSAPTDHGDWLIFADSGGIGAALAGLVNASGRRGVLVTRGESFEKLGPHHFCVNPESSPDLRRLFETIAPADRSVRRTIVHLWSLDANAPDETTVASLEHALTLGCASVLRLVRELARTAPDGSPRLCLVTRGAQAAGEVPTPIDVGQAPLWGLGRVIAQEQPLLWGGLLDLESGNAPLNDTARLLWDEISDPDGEDQIALRQGQRYVLRLVRKARAGKTETPVHWRANGSYLITGGLGALGLAMASWMVERGARHLILLGRTALPPRAHWNSLEAQSPHANQVAAIRELEALGASIHQAPLDVADENQLRAFLDNYRAEGWPPICGVIHAAGVLQDGLLEQLDTTALRSVFRPKVTGGWLLHRMLADMPLDFFVLFSSAGAILGQAGQGNYAAANAFLDALAHFRKAQARPALSINWGAWNGLGFAQSTGGKRLAAHLASMGIKTIAPTQALAVLDRLIPQNGAQVIAVPVDWTQYRKILPAGATSRLLSELILISEQTGSSSPAADQEAGQKRALILAANPADRLELLQAHLSGMVARVLGLPITQLDLRQPLSNLGLDSLMAVELKNRIAVDLGVNLPMVTFLSGPSVERATAQILNLLSADAPIAPMRRLAPALAQNDQPSNSSSATEYRLQDLDEYSDEEVNSLLTELLGEEEVGE
jgi:NADP-dependent 3-hydroxy acid dehydrogenase YdfG/acyl carrier protein